MQFLESPISRSFDFFKQILDCPDGIHNQIDFNAHQKNLQISNNFTPLDVKQKMNNENAYDSKPECKWLQMAIGKKQQPQQQILSQLPTHKIKRRFFNEKNETSKRSTHHQTNFEQGELSIVKNEKNFQPVLDFSSANFHEQIDNPNMDNKKTKRVSKQMQKGIMKQKQFGKTLKLSFPKKLVEMFLNHYANFQIENEEIKDYNINLRTKLKQSKKNDYTFEKQVSQILGQNDLQISSNLSQQISQINRRIFSQIINSKMKEEVIMRDKIAKNRELYMIQLKVYALRCRSKKLSKKGTYK